MNEPQYAELHCRTNFSFLEGASHADELVGQAAQLGYHALALALTRILIHDDVRGESRRARTREP